MHTNATIPNQQSKTTKRKNNKEKLECLEDIQEINHVYKRKLKMKKTENKSKTIISLLKQKRLQN